MKKTGKRYTEDEILKVLKEIEAGGAIASVARAHGVTDQTIYHWREKYGGRWYHAMPYYFN